MIFLFYLISLALIWTAPYYIDVTLYLALRFIIIFTAIKLVENKIYEEEFSWNIPSRISFYIVLIVSLTFLHGLLPSNVETVKVVSPTFTTELGWVISLKYIFLFIISAPIGEEIVYRRFLIGFFRNKKIPLGILIFVSMISFIFAHIPRGMLFSYESLWIGIQYLPMTIVFTLAYLKHGLVTSTMLHMLYNLLVALREYDIYFGLFILIIIVLSIYYTWKKLTIGFRKVHWIS